MKANESAVDRVVRGGNCRRSCRAGAGGRQAEIGAANWVACCGGGDGCDGGNRCVPDLQRTRDIDL